jgi:hypothetical protein
MNALPLLSKSSSIPIRWSSRPSAARIFTAFRRPIRTTVFVACTCCRSMKSSDSRAAQIKTFREHQQSEIHQSLTSGRAGGACWR